jgi:hypothetical protein
MTVARFRLRGLLKWNLLVWCFAAGFAWHTWQSAWVPADMIPCYHTYIGDSHKETIDWQMAHPFWSGIYSGMTLGLWPNGYAIPRGCTYANEGRGIPPWAYTPFAQAAFPAFRVYATGFTFLFVWLYGALLAWAFRPAPGYTWGLRHSPQSLLHNPSSLPDTGHSQDSVLPGKEASETKDSPA